MKRFIDSDNKAAERFKILSSSYAETVENREAILDIANELEDIQLRCGYLEDFYAY